MAVTVVEKYPDTTKDLMYNILLALGGTDMDIEEKYFDTSDDLLYAILKKLQGGIPGGNGNFAAGNWKIDLEFDGTAGKGAVGHCTLPASALQSIPAGTVIYEVAVVIVEELTAAAGSHILLGIEDEHETAGLDAGTGDVETLNTSIITKILTPDFKKSAATQLFSVAVGGSPITAGKVCIIFQTLNFAPVASTGGDV